jgi:hypothetical protein
MLGFSPLASAPLGDDGAIIIYLIDDDSNRRQVHVSALSNSVAAVTGSPNSAIVPQSTPNSVIVLKPKEAA